MIRFLQINIGECRLAHDLMMMKVVETRTDMVVVSEPNTILAAKLPSCYMDKGRRTVLITLTLLSSSNRIRVEYKTGKC